MAILFPTFILAALPGCWQLGPVIALQHEENHVTKSRHFQFKKSFNITKMARSSKILVAAEIMSMPRDIKLKET